MLGKNDTILCINESDANHEYQRLRNNGYLCHVEKVNGRWFVVIDGKESLFE